MKSEPATLPTDEPIAVTPPPSSAAHTLRPSWRIVVVLALPVLGQHFLNWIIMLSDRFLTGRLNVGSGDPAAYQAAQTTAMYLAWFISSYAVLVSVGSTALVARFVGAEDRDGAVHATHQSLWLALILGIAGTITGVAGVDTMMRMLQLEGSAAEYASAYLLPIFWLLPFQMVETAGIACLIGAGDTRTGLWVTLGVAVLNVPLSWGLCLGLGPLPQMGFVGIALGTALSHMLGGFAVFAVLCRGRFDLKLQLRLMGFDWSMIRRLLRISIPAGFDSLMLIIGQFWFLSVVNRLGEVAGSAHGIAIVWEAPGFLAGLSFGTAAMTLVGQNLGARKPDQAASSGWVALAIGGGVMTVMGVVFYVLARPMFTLFCPYPSQQPIVDLGVPVLRLIAFAMPMLAVTIIFTQALRGAGDTRVPVLFTLVGMFLVRVPLGIYLALPDMDFGSLGVVPGWNLGLIGAWWAMLADIMIRGSFFLYRFLSGSWKRIRV